MVFKPMHSLKSSVEYYSSSNSYIHYEVLRKYKTFVKQENKNNKKYPWLSIKFNKTKN